MEVDELMCLLIYIESKYQHFYGINVRLIYNHSMRHRHVMTLSRLGEFFLIHLRLVLPVVQLSLIIFDLVFILHVVTLEP